MKEQLRIVSPNGHLGFAPTKEESFRLPEVKGTAGTAAFVTDEVLPATTSYRWTMNHIVPVDDPMSLFDLHLVDVGSEALQPTLQPQA